MFPGTKGFSTTNLRYMKRYYDSRIDQGLNEDNIMSINQGLYEMAKYMNVDLEYSDTEEFCDYMDSNTVISL